MLLRIRRKSKSDSLEAGREYGCLSSTVRRKEFQSSLAVPGEGSRYQSWPHCLGERLGPRPKAHVCEITPQIRPD